MMQNLSLVIAAYNEVDRLPPTLEKVTAVLAGLAVETEIIVVDDGSTDATLEAAETFRGPVPVRAIRLMANRGKGAAVARGIEEARYPLVGFTDADCPYDLEALVAMAESLSAGDADVGVGARDLPDSQVHAGYGGLRILSGQALSFLTWALIGLPFRDSQCGLKLFRREVARKLFAMRTIDRFGFDFEILAAAIAGGYSIQRFAVRFTHNNDSRINVLRDSLAVLRDLWRVRGNIRRGVYAPLSGDARACSCPLCGADDFSPRVAKQGFRMVECRLCGLWYLNPMPEPELLRDLYGEEYFTSDTPQDIGYSGYDSMGEDLRATSARRLELVEDHVGAGRLLDVGAGFGYMADAARGKFGERWALEMNQRAANRIAPDHRVIVENFVSADLPAEHFDVVSMQDSLEHMPDPREALAKVRTLLRPQGAFLIATPDQGSWLAYLQGRNWLSLKFPEHVILYREATVRRLLEEAGFAIETLQPARQYARADFIVSRALRSFPLLSRVVERTLRGLGADRRGIYVLSGSMVIVAKRR